MNSSELNKSVDNTSVLHHPSHSINNTEEDSGIDHNQTPLLVDVISLDHTSVDGLLSLLRSMGCNVRQSHFNPTDANSLSDARTSEFVCLVGDSEVIINSGILQRYKTLCPRATLVVGSSSLNLKTVSSLIRGGAKTFFELPARQDRLMEDIGWLITSVSEKRVGIREQITHYQNYCSLTNPELEVLRKMLSGCANKQIAQMLSIGLRTVELRRSKIMRKMQAKNISQLVYYIYKSGANI